MKNYIVVGSGIAGLIAAIELSAEHAVTLVTKAALAESNTRWAQGGIAAAMFSDDSIADHIADFSLAYLRKERTKKPASIRIRRRPWQNNKHS